MRVIQASNTFERFRELTTRCVEHKRQIGLPLRDYDTLASAAQSVFDKHGLTEDKIRIVAGEVSNLLPAWLLLEGIVTRDEYHEFFMEIIPEVSRTGLTPSYTLAKDSNGMGFKIIPLIPQPIYEFGLELGIF